MGRRRERWRRKMVQRGRSGDGWRLGADFLIYIGWKGSGWKLWCRDVGGLVAAQRRASSDFTPSSQLWKADMRSDELLVRLDSFSMHFIDLAPQTMPHLSFVAFPSSDDAKTLLRKEPGFPVNQIQLPPLCCARVTNFLLLLFFFPSLHP